MKGVLYVRGHVYAMDDIVVVPEVDNATFTTTQEDLS